MQWWQWVLGSVEFVAAWYATTGYFDWRKRRALEYDEREGQPTEHLRWIAEQDAQKPHLRWIAEQDAMVTGEDGRDYRMSPNLHIPDDWRETMARKEQKYYRGSTPQHIADDLREKLRNTKPPPDWPIKQCIDCRREARKAIHCHDGWRCRECLDKLAQADKPPDRSDLGDHVLSFMTGVYAIHAARQGWKQVKGAPGWWTKP